MKQHGKQFKQMEKIWKNKTFHNRGSPKHQDTQLGSKNLPQ